MNSKKGCIGNKKSQVSIFIIISLIILIILILLFINRNQFNTIFNPQSNIEQFKDCVETSLSEGVNIIEAQGGSIEPENYYLYNGTKVEYLCYTEEDYVGCVMQKPLLKQDIENELKEYMNPRVKNCLTSFEYSLINEGYEVSASEPNLTLEIVPQNIIITISSDLTIEKDIASSYKNIKIDHTSELYKLIMIANSISNWEARYGYSEPMNYMIYDHNLIVEKKARDEGTRIYIISDKITGERFMFASRSRVIPIGGERYEN